MKTGMVVLNYNDATETINFIQQISAYQLVDTICVVDNGSTDDSLQKLKKIRKKEVVVLPVVHNGGYAAGNNVGLRYLYERECDLLIVANPDIEVSYQNLQDFITFVKSYPGYDVFGPTIQEQGKLNRGWRCPTLFTDILDNLVLINRLFKNNRKYRTHHYVGAISQVECVSGCFFGMTRKVIDSIGYLDEETFLYYEENILAKKMQEAKLKTCVLNTVTVKHNHSITIDKNSNRYQKLRALKDSQYHYQESCFKHSHFGLWILKKTADFSCFIARIRTNNKVLRKNKNKKKKVTILSLHMKVGGIEKAISSLANMLIDTYEVEIINVYKLVDTPSFPIDERVTISYLSTNMKPNKEAFKEAVAYKDIKNIFKEGIKASYVLYQKRKRIKKAAKVCNGDIIVSTALAFNKAFANYQKDKVLIAWEHSHPNSQARYTKKIQKKTKKFDVFIPASRAVYNYYKEILTGPKCMYVPLSIDAMPLEKASLQTNQITVMGRLEKEKGYDDMLRVLKKVITQNEDVILHVLGDGSKKEELKELAKKLGIDKHVIFHGNVVGEEKHQILLNTSVFVTSSHFESFGLVLLEAMSYGIPCVSFSSAEGSLEIIEQGKNGYIIEDRNLERMADTIVSLLNKTTKTMQKQALSKARKYLYPNVKKQWLEAFTMFSQGDIKVRVLFTSSAGGHYSELCELQELMTIYNSFLLTEDHEMMVEQKQHNKARSWYLRAGTKEHLIKFLYNFPFNIVNSFRVYIKVKPDVVIATGAHTTVPICYIAKLFRKKVIFIETFANITTKTLSGKLVYPIADEFFVQWEEMVTLYPKAKFKGGLK